MGKGLGALVRTVDQNGQEDVGYEECYGWVGGLAYWGYLHDVVREIE